MKLSNVVIEMAEGRYSTDHAVVVDDEDVAYALQDRNWRVLYLYKDELAGTNVKERVLRSKGPIDHQIQDARYPSNIDVIVLNNSDLITLSLDYWTPSVLAVRDTEEQSRLYLKAIGYSYSFMSKYLENTTLWTRQYDLVIS